MFSLFSSLCGAVRIDDRTLSRLLYLTVVTLLIPLISGCDTAGPVGGTTNTDEATPAAHIGKLGGITTTIQLPEPAVALTDHDDFQFDPAGYWSPPRHVPHPIWLRRVEESPSWDAAIGNAAMAALSIAALPPRAQIVWRPRLSSAVERVLSLSEQIVRLPEPTVNDISDLLGNRFVEIATLCFVNFNNHDILDAFPDQAATTFVVDPYWRQDCGSAGQVRVLPATMLYNHYHLVFEDPDIGCIDFDTGTVGRDVDGECEGPLEDYADEPRLLGTMGGDEVIQIRVFAPGTDTPIPFSVPSFQNAGDEPVRFRYQSEGGSWFEWPSLAGNTHWGTSVFNAVEVLITNAGTSLDCGIDTEAGGPGGCMVDETPFFLDDFVIGIQ